MLLSSTVNFAGELKRPEVRSRKSEVRSQESEVTLELFINYKRVKLCCPITFH